MHLLIIYKIIIKTTRRTRMRCWLVLLLCVFVATASSLDANAYDAEDELFQGQADLEMDHDEAIDNAARLQQRDEDEDEDVDDDEDDSEDGNNFTLMIEENLELENKDDDDIFYNDYLSKKEDLNDEKMKLQIFRILKSGKEPLKVPKVEEKQDIHAVPIPSQVFEAQFSKDAAKTKKKAEMKTVSGKVGLGSPYSLEINNVPGNTLVQAVLTSLDNNVDLDLCLRRKAGDRWETISCSWNTGNKDEVSYVMEDGAAHDVSWFVETLQDEGKFKLMHHP